MASNVLASALASNPSFGPTVNTSAPLTAATTGYAAPQAAPTVQTLAAAPKAPVVQVPSIALAAAAKQTPGPNLVAEYGKIGAKAKATAAQTATGGSGAIPPTRTAVGSAAAPGDEPSPHGIVAAAHTMLGVPYVWGGTNTKSGLDCSAFVQASYAKIGIQIPRTTYAQYAAGTPVALNKLQPGDAVYVEPEKNGPGHVGLYLGNGQVQESPHTGTVNQIVPLNVFLKDGYVGSRRF